MSSRDDNIKNGKGCKFMKKHKNMFIVSAVVLAVLAGAWFWGAPADIAPAVDITPTIAAQPILAPSTPPPIFVAEEEVVFDDAEEVYEASEIVEAEEIEYQEPEVPPIEAPTPIEEAPAAPAEAITDDGSFTVVLLINVNMLLQNMDLLHRDKHELVPESGWIFAPQAVTVYEGESVFNVLQREMRRHGIHLATRWTPILNSAYIEAINNIYEFDAGALSGWMYSVNGYFPSFGSSRYLLSDGDVIEWQFTLDLGRDLGGAGVVQEDE